MEKRSGKRVIHGVRRYVPGYGLARAETDCGLSLPGRHALAFGPHVTCKRCLAAQQREAEAALAMLEREDYGEWRLK